MISKIDITGLSYDFYPTHPGEVLKDEFEARGVSQCRFADSIGVDYSVLSEILNGRRSLSITIVLMFEAVLGVSVESLMKLQLKYSMQVTRIDRTLADKLKEVA